MYGGGIFFTFYKYFNYLGIDWMITMQKLSHYYHATATLLLCYGNTVIVLRQHSCCCAYHKKKDGVSATHHLKSLYFFSIFLPFLMTMPLYVSFTR